MTETSAPGDPAVAEFDLDEDSVPDVALVDTDADAVADVVAFDLDEDSVPETVVVDTDADGVADVAAFDLEETVPDEQPWVPEEGERDLSEDSLYTPPEDITDEDLENAEDDLEHTQLMGQYMQSQGVI